jgi:phage FluMu protein Com
LNGRLESEESRAMPEERQRFRCYQCNQLLGVSPKKAGSVIACPRCKAELKVPTMEETAPNSDALSSGAGAEPQGRTRGGSVAAAAVSESRAASSLMSDIAAAIPDDLVSLRPEDIRVEAEFADLIVGPTPAPGTPVEVPVVLDSPRAEPAVPVAEERSPRTAIPVEAALPPAPVTPVTPPATDAPLVAGLPQIKVETPAIRSKGPEIRSVQEVVLQPATVLAWSLLVLLALPMAFVAGLLLGHYVWK